MMPWTRCWTNDVEIVVVRTPDDDSGKSGEVGIARQEEENGRKGKPLMPAALQSGEGAA